MRLYLHPLSSNSRRALMTALHLGIPLERTVVDLAKGEQKLPPHLARNPNGRVPVLDDDGFLLWESRAIMKYLAERTPGQTLYPSEPRARADVDRWLFWCAAHLSPALGVLTFENFVKRLAGRGEPDPVEVARGEALVAQFAPVLDAHLAGRTWVSGDHVTLADLSLAPPLALTHPAKLPVSSYPNLQAWFARVQTLDAWKQTAA
jgi:glutathione S-transferase